MKPVDLAGKRVLITGGASGIGRATAERCKADGYDVVVIDRDIPLLDGDFVIADSKLVNW